MKKLLAILLALFAIATMCVSCSKKEEEDDSWKDSYMQEDNEDIDHIQVNDETFYFEAVDSESVAITGYQGSDIKCEDPLSLQWLGYGTIGNLLRQPFDNRCFSNAGVADQAGVVFSSAGEYPYEPIRFGFSSNQGIQ